MGIILFLLLLAVPVGIFYYNRHFSSTCDVLNSFASTNIVTGGYSVLLIVLYSLLVVQINPGEVGVVVDMLGADKGVEEQELGVGLHLLMPWQNVYTFPVYEQNHEWIAEDGFSFQTIEGLSVHADIGITYNLSPDKVHELFWKYRRGMDEITHLFIRNNLRDAINQVSSKMRIEELYGDKKEEFFAEVHNRVRAELADIGFNISHLYIIGRFKVPDMVLEALNRKIEATQKAQQRENELREAEAQARKEVAKAEGEARSTILRAKANADAIFMEAKAKADSNKLLTQSLSNELIKWEYVNKWDGVMPKILSEKSGLMLQLPIDRDSTEGK